MTVLAAIVFCGIILAMVILLKSPQYMQTSPFPYKTFFLEMWNCIQSGIREVVSEIPYMGQFFSLIITGFTVETITPATGVEQAFSIVLMTVFVGWTTDILFKKANWLKSDSKGTLIITMSIISIILGSSAMVIINILLDFIRSKGLSLEMYVGVLLIVTAVVATVYCCEKKYIEKKTFKQILGLLIVDICISLSILLLCAICSLLIIIDKNALTTKDIVILICSIVGITTVVSPYMIYLKQKYD